MTAWAVTAIRKKHPDAEIVWVVQDAGKPVIDTAELVDEIILYPRKKGQKTSFGEMARFHRDLRSRSFDVGFDFQGHTKTALTLRLAKPKLRLQSRATDAFAARLNTIPDSCSKAVHDVDRAYALVRAWEEIDEPVKPIMPSLEDERGQFKDQGDFISLQTDSGHPNKIYPIELWAEVVKGLQNLGHRVVLIGGPNSPDLPEFESLVGELTLRESFACVAESRLHIAADTGTIHAAAAYGVPVVTVFGDEMPKEQFYPWTEQRRVLYKGEQPSLVSPEEIVQAAVELMEETA